MPKDSPDMGRTDSNSVANRPLHLGTMSVASYSSNRGKEQDLHRTLLLQSRSKAYSIFLRPEQHIMKNSGTFQG